VYSSLCETHRRATEHHLPYGINGLCGVTCNPTQAELTSDLGAGYILGQSSMEVVAT